MIQKRPIVDALIKFQHQQSVSFHVPGHKHGQLSGLPKEIQQALAYDLTELSGLDDLHYPEEIIKEAQSLLSKAYGSQKSYFLVNGSTVGNLAMIQAVCKEGSTVIVQRNSHKSIFHGLELAKVRPVYVSPEWDADSMTTTGVSVKTMEEALSSYPSAKAVVLTHPNYYGMAVQELEEIIDLCHQKGIAVLIDEAHGAHFKVGGPFPASSLQFGADAVVHSAHKTLPAMTMGSYLHISGNLIDPQKVGKYLHMLQSSSPSYLIMASLDDARAFVDGYSHPDIRSFMEKRERFIEGLRSIPSLHVFEADDPLKLLLRVEHHTGFQLQQKIEQQGFHAELADPYQVLLILPLLKQKHSYPFAEIRSRLKEAVHSLKSETREFIGMDWPSQKKISVPVLTYEEIELADTEWVTYTQAIGRIAAGMVTPYPPGVPLVVAGEVWTAAKLGELMDFLALGASVQGSHRVAEKQLSVIQQGGVIYE